MSERPSPRNQDNSSYKAKYAGGPREHGGGHGGERKGKVYDSRSTDKRREYKPREYRGPRTYERKTPEIEKTPFQDFMSDVLEISTEAQRAHKTSAEHAFGESARALLEDVAGEETGEKKHDFVRELDARLRGRDTGDWKTRIARTAAYMTIGAGSLGVDVLDSPTFWKKATGSARVKKMIPDRVKTTATAFEGKKQKFLKDYKLHDQMLAAGWEYTTDYLITEGFDSLVQHLSGEQTYKYSSPISRKIGQYASLIPVIREFTSAPLVESAFRLAGNVPVAGVPIDRLYKALNQKLSDKTKGAEFTDGLITTMIKGELEGGRKAESTKKDEAWEAEKRQREENRQRENEVKESRRNADFESRKKEADLRYEAARKARQDAEERQAIQLEKIKNLVEGLHGRLDVIEANEHAAPMGDYVAQAPKVETPKKKKR